MRKTHNGGVKHKDNVRLYYEGWFKDNFEAIVAAGVPILPITPFVPFNTSPFNCIADVDLPTHPAQRGRSVAGGAVAAALAAGGAVCDASLHDPSALITHVQGRTRMCFVCDWIPTMQAQNATPLRPGVAAVV